MTVERMTGVAGGILAGGAARRLGGIRKDLILIDGRPLIERTVELMSRIFEEIVVVTPDPGPLPGRHPRLVLARDELPGLGPLAGLQAGLAATTREAVFFVACDMPFLQPGLIRRMARGFAESGCEILLPRIGEMVEPVHALYHTALLDRLRHQLTSGGSLSIRAIFDQARTCHFDLPDDPATGRVFFNLNTPQDLAELRRAGLRVELPPA